MSGLVRLVWPVWRDERPILTLKKASRVVSNLAFGVCHADPGTCWDMLGHDGSQVCIILAEKFQCQFHCRIIPSSSAQR
jgi:hypothetical protein